MTAPYYPRAGANLYVRRPTLLSQAIAWATRSCNEGPTLATHQAKFIGSTIVHATTRGVVEEPWEKYAEELELVGCEFAVTERVKPLPSEINVVKATLRGMIGWRYSYWELPLQLADGLLSKLFGQNRHGLDVLCFRLMGDIWEKGVICSKTGNRADIKVGWKPRWLEYGNPDDSWDYDSNPRNKWKVAYETRGWRER